MCENKKPHSADYLGEARDYWWNEDYLDSLARRFELSNCTTLVDVGCGKGYMAYKFAPYLKYKAMVYGFDRELRWIKEARCKNRIQASRGDIEFHFETGDACNIPLPDGVADITMCQTLLIHLQEPLKAISEMKRVTNEAGWIVAIEPNNVVSSLIQDSLDEGNIEVKLADLEVQMRMERGKKTLGEGFSSIGDRVPELFQQAGLKDIQVWLADKALALIPPYDTHEKRLRAQELLDWVENEQAFLNYEEQLRYYLAGGGSSDKFHEYWLRLQGRMEKLKFGLANETYVYGGGSLMYIVAGRK